jgi:hypothetical protein
MSKDTIRTVAYKVTVKKRIGVKYSVRSVLDAAIIKAVYRFIETDSSKSITIKKKYK